MITALEYSNFWNTHEDDMTVELIDFLLSVCLTENHANS